MNVHIITLGCKVNAYESEIIKEKFLAQNYKIVDDLSKAQIVVVNTCSVTNMADNKSKKIIRSIKRENKEAIIVACGCMTQNHQDKLVDLDIDILIGTNNKSQIVELVTEYLKNRKTYQHFDNMQTVPFEDMQVAKFSSLTRAFLKIQDGCDNYCSYCVIPYLRGAKRCKDFNIALKEAESLVQNGHKEIVLTGIHTGSYQWEDKDLTDLIEAMSQIPNLKRIRISSIEILEITDKFIKMLQNNAKVCNHLHIPLQSGSDKILKLMNRRYNKQKFQEIVTKIRKVRPDINLTTDLIVGFPGETEDDFLESFQFCQKLGFSKIHTFPFSLRSGTKAETLPNHLDNALKKERVKKIMTLSSQLETTYYQKFLHKNVEVLVEKSFSQYSLGHTSNYILVRINQKLEPNQLYTVKIVNVSKECVNAEAIDCLIIN